MMNVNLREDFEKAVCNALGDVFHDYGYEFCGGYSRAPGIALEFVHDSQRLFVVSEGNLVVLDLVLCEDPSRYWRVSVNQALWFGGVKAVAERMPLADTLALFAAAIPRCCGQLFSGDLSALDPRYCFPISASGLDAYLLSQRGR